MEKQISAVDYVVDELILELHLNCNLSKDKKDFIVQVVNKARKKFEEQIVHAATYGANAETPEQYYKKIYGK